MSRGEARVGRGEENGEQPYRSATFQAVGATVLAVVGAAEVWASSRVDPENLCR